MSRTPQTETRKSRKAHAALNQETYENSLHRLITAREESGMSERKICERMEMPHSFLSKCGTGDRRIDVLEFLELARLYEKPLHFFLD